MEDYEKYLNLMKTVHASHSIYAVGVYGFPLDTNMDGETIIAPQINPHIATDWWEDYEIVDKLMLYLRDKIVKEAELKPYDIHQNVIYKISENDKNPILFPFLLHSVTYQGIRIIESKVWEINVAAI